MAYLEAALEIFTYEAFPVEWSWTQNSLGMVYASLPDGDHQTNLAEAINRYQAALEVHTLDAFPIQWAKTQYNLGKTYLDLAQGTSQDYFVRAISYYQNALKIFQSLRVETYAREVRESLESIQNLY